MRMIRYKGKNLTTDELVWTLASEHNWDVAVTLDLLIEFIEEQDINLAILKRFLEERAA